MTEPLAQQILDLIYHATKVRQADKDSLTDWILDTQSRTAPLSTRALLDYLAVHQAGVLNRLKIDVLIKDKIAQVLRGVDPG